MKTLKEVLREAGQTTGTPGGSGNWSISGPDLAKQWAADPEFKKKLTAHTPSSADQLVKRVTSQLAPEAFVGMSDQEMDMFVNKLNQVVDAQIWQAKKQRDKTPDPRAEKPTSPGGKPMGTKIEPKGGTQPAIPSQMPKK